MMSAGKAAFDHVQRSSGLLTIPVHFFIPVVVIDAPLFGVLYRDDRDLEIQPLKRGLLLWNQVVAGRSRNGIYIVQKDHVQEFLADCVRCADWWLNLPKDMLVELQEAK